MAETTIVLTGEQQARQELAREIRELAKNPPDKATVPGGRFLGTDGEFHDAEGRKVSERESERESESKSSSKAASEEKKATTTVDSAERGNTARDSAPAAQSEGKKAAKRKAGSAARGGKKKPA